MAGLMSVALSAGAAIVGADAGKTAPVLFGAPLEFYLFGATLLGVALFHHRTFLIAASGLAAIVAYKFVFTGFKSGPGLVGLLAHFEHEKVILANLFLLLIGFAVLSRHFEDSKMPDKLPHLLPHNWTGGVALLGLVFVLSAFLDNIAGALIGGVVARHVYRQVTVGYLAAIVAASNAGGAGSVVGDTTTTMMWIDGVSPVDVLHAYVAAVVAFFVFAVPISIRQQRISPIRKHDVPGIRIDRARVGIIIFILVSAIGANAGANIFAPALLDHWPMIGLAVWAAIIVGAVVRRPNLGVALGGVKGAVFLLCLVACASLMPVEALPPASWPTALGLGFVSSVFDNIPLTALALKQGGYDWGVLAYAVGFGGSMVWFGSSAGVAISNLYPDAKSVGRWLAHGWPVIVGYVVGFAALIALLGWHPHAPHKTVPAPAALEHAQ